MFKRAHVEPRTAIRKRGTDLYCSNNNFLPCYNVSRHSFFVDITEKRSVSIIKVTALSSGEY